MAEGDLIHPNKFDADRGGIVARDLATDTKVCMYIDEPGVFFTMSGHEVSDDLARSAGFDVEALREEAAFQGALREAEAQLRAEFDERRKALGGVRPSKVEEPKAKEPVEIPLQTGAKPAVKAEPESDLPDIRETEYHEMRHRGHGKWDVFEAGTAHIVLENIDKETAVSFMLEQQEQAELGIG